MDRLMEKLIREKDWGSSPLGPIESWPPTLTTLINVMLKSRFPMFLFWGPDLISFYNDAFKPSLGVNGKHPHILGRPGREAWAEIWDFIKPLIDQALAGEAVWREDLLVPFYRNGRIEDIYWTFSYSQVTDESGKSMGVLVICNETTEQIKNTNLLRESENRFRDIVFQTPIGITIFKGRDFVVDLANQKYLEVIDKKEEDFVGKPFFEQLPELAPKFRPLLLDVYETGIPYFGTEVLVIMKRYGRTEDTYFNFVYYPLRDNNSSIIGIIVVAAEVTDQVKAKFKVLESESKFRELIMKSPVPMTIFRGEEFIIEVANTVMIDSIWRKKEADVIGKKLLDVFPELNQQKYPEILKKVYSSGKVHSEKESVAYVQGDDGMRRFVFDYNYTPLFDPKGEVWGLIVTLNDVTEKVDVRKRIEENEDRLNIVIGASELGTWELNFKTKAIHYSDRYLEILGYKERVELTHEQILKHLHPDDLKIREEAYKKALETGTLHYVSRLIWNDGSVHWMEGKGRLFYDQNGSPEKMLGTVRDITDEKNQKEILQKSEQKFRLLAESMHQMIWTTSAAGKFTYCNHLFYQYSGLPMESTDDGWFSILHDDDRSATDEAWSHSIRSGEDFLMEHRFRSHDGSYHWHLSSATPQKDLSGNIVMWVGSSADIQAQKAFTQELERNVQQRTSELAEKNKALEKMNSELKSFAYVSSHDLQEPLRKIQTFASRIKDIEKLSEKGRDYFDRIQKSANQMQVLIQDLLAYSRTSKIDPVYEMVDLNDLLKDIRNDFYETLIDKNAIIETEASGHVRMIPLQFRQVMYNLISNSLKFSKPDVSPRVVVTLKPELDGRELQGKFNSGPNKYYKISVSDNGIGFHPQYRERIFEVFQRLHAKHEYSGTGVGLAIVKKIIENHEGFIEANSTPGEGAQFDIYLPYNGPAAP